MQILSVIESNPEVTQRELSRRVGIALGLTNALMRNLAQKGYVRVAQATWKRRLYTLTPEGFSHRLGLLVSYVNRFFYHYRSVRQTLREELLLHPLHVESRVAMCGTGEFAELVYLGLREIGIEDLDIFGSQSANGQRFLGLPVRDLADLKPEQYDRVVVAQLGDTSATDAALQEQDTPSEKLITFLANRNFRMKG